MNDALQNTAPAPKEIKRWTQQKRTEYIQREIAAGRHLTTFKTVCYGCGQWVGAIFTITFDKKRLCEPCATGKGDRK